MAETTRALTTGAGNLFASSITPGMSTLAYESVTSETSKNNFFYFSIYA
jgi:hypothetical protein